MKRALFSHVRIDTSVCSAKTHSGSASLAPNTDGINIQGEDIVVEHCTVRNGDDCVPIFPPSRNVSVNNISCSCGNGLTIAVWGLVPGGGGDIANVSFRDVSFHTTINAVSFKSLPSFVGSAHNISFENLRLTDVTKAVTINFFNQGTRSAVASEANGLAPSGFAPQVEGIGRSAYRHLAARSPVQQTTGDSLSISNMTGTVRLNAGHIYCAASLPCTGISMRGVRLTSVVGADAAVGGYNCTYASGTSDDCSPVPCRGDPWPPAAL